MSQENLYNQLLQQDLLSHLNEQEKSELIEVASKKGVSASEIVYAIPRLIFSFDSEYFWTPETYRDLISDLVSISRNLYSLEDIKFSFQDESEGNILLSYTINNLSFSNLLQVNGDWFDPALISQLNDSLGNTNIRERYYWIDTQDQLVVTIFLNDQQFSLLYNILGSHLKDYQQILDH